MLSEVVHGAALSLSLHCAADGRPRRLTMDTLSLRLSDGTTIAVPASLNSITTYVVLEQEAWFEKEMAFLANWLRPGMRAIDVGANLGVYSLPMARLVAPDGQVFSYEPGSEPRRLLEHSKSLNQAANLHVIAAALSDRPREGQLILGPSSELSSLAGNGSGGPASSESVQITCLDQEEGARAWASIDFIKIDAEGEEERILVGGRSFFERHSPLAMFEVKAGSEVNESLRATFPSYGYRVYRLLGGAPVLVPDRGEKPLDGYELNLFAAKPDRAATLARDGFLAQEVPDWRPDQVARASALEDLREQAFTTAFEAGFKRDIDSGYLDGLAGYAIWRSAKVPLPERCGALDFACRALIDVCKRSATLARLSTLARATWEAGERSICVNALRAFGDLLRRGEKSVDEPFWPANPRFDTLAPGAQGADWFFCSAFEQLERTVSFSSVFGDSGINLTWFSQQPFTSPEIERRRVLRRARAGERVEVPARLCVAAADHVNADTWRAGLVPNTWVRSA